MLPEHVLASQPATVTEPAADTAPAAREEFARLLSTHWNHAYRFAHRLTNNTEDADDLIQQAAEEALRGFARFQTGTRFDRWFLRIIYSSFIDQMRRRRRRKLFSIEDVPQEALAADGRTHEAAFDESLDGPVRRALQALPPEYRAVVILVDMEGRSYEDAAAILRRPVGTIRSRLHRARLALREWLRPYVDAMKRGEL